MTTLLVKFVALASSIMLLLPPGWCRGSDCCQSEAPAAVEAASVSVNSTVPESSLAESSHAGGSCCQRRVATQPTSDSTLAIAYVRATSPAHALANCCCTQGKQVTVKVVAPDEFAVSPLAAVTPQVVLPAVQPAQAVADSSPTIAGPPLRILHGVWRC